MSASIVGDIRTFLLGDGTLSGLVGTRIYAGKLPQNPAFPAISITWISGLRTHTASGPIGLSRPRITFDTWAKTYLECESVFDALRKRLDGYQGPIGGSPAHTVQGSFFDSERDGYESEPELYRRSADFFVWYEEATS